MNTLGSSGQQSFSFDSALEGLERAAAHAEHDDPGWTGRAAAMLRAYIAAHPGRPFVTPEVRDWAYAAGLSQPPTHLAWGGVMLAASRAGWIRRKGFVAYSGGAMHMQSVAQWEAA